MPVLLALLASPVAADAHAVLAVSSPAADQRIDSAVQRVTLTFDSPVEAGLSSIRVLDAAGADRSVGAPAPADAAHEALIVRTTPLRHGHFVVAWRVVSADSHVVSGAFAFGVGEPAGEVPPALAHPPEPGLPLLMTILRIGSIASLLTAVGLCIAGMAVPGRMAARAALARSAWLTVSVIAFVAFFGQADFLGVGPLRLLESRSGALRIAVVLGGLLGVAALQRGKRALLVVAVLLVVVGEVYSGHAATGARPAIGVIVDSVHLVAAAAWVGVLIVALAAPSAANLQRVSQVAAASVLVLAATAVPQTLRNIATVSALQTTVYGRIVCVKAGIFVLALAIAAWARRRIGTTVGVGALVRAELALIGGLTLVTGLLVDTPPPRGRAIPAPRTEASFALGDRLISFAAQRSAEREYLLRITTTSHAQPADIDDVRAWVREANRGIGPLPVILRRLDRGRYVGQVTLPFAGHWRIWVSGRAGDFDEIQRSFRL